MTLALNMEWIGGTLSKASMRRGHGKAGGGHQQQRHTVNEREPQAARGNSPVNAAKRTGCA